MVVWQGGRVAAWIVAAIATVAGLGVAPARAQVPTAPSLERTIDSGLVVAQASPDVRYLGQWIGARHDHGGNPFAIVDKKAARLYVFDEQGALVGTSTVLTGSAVGDTSVPGVGQRAQTGRLAPDERTTPAGRFPSDPGRNLNGEDIVWFDYGAALAIHRLRDDATRAQRAARLATPTAADNRASLGCVVVPVAFYERVVRPTLGARRGVVYVLPDHKPVQAWWPQDAGTASSAAE